MLIPKPSQVCRNITNFYVAAVQKEEIPFLIVFVIAMYTPFELFALKWLPSAISGPLRFLPEVILYGLTAKVLGKRLFQNHHLQATPIDILLPFFFLSTFISIAINGSDLIPSIDNLRSLWRYLSVYYIVVNINISLEQLNLMLKGIKFVGLLQAVLAFFQYLLPVGFQQFFAPGDFQVGDYERVSQAEAGKVKSGAVFGMFTNPSVLAAFLLFVIAITTSHIYIASPGWTNIVKLREYSSWALLVFGVFASKKRAPLVMVFLIPLIFLFFHNRIRRLLKIGWLYAAILFLVVLGVLLLGTSVDTSFTSQDEAKGSINLASYLFQIFSPEYYEHSAESSRGWVIQTTISTLLKSGSWFGFGPDLENMRNIMFDLLTSASDRSKIFDLQPLEDVYWLAMLAYFGPIGLGIYSLILWRLFRIGRWLTLSSPLENYRLLGSLFCTLIVVTILYNFVSRTLEFRPYSFYFWLTSGLVVNVYNRHGNGQSLNSFDCPMLTRE
ncbi:hypothetical protein [Acaryochloris sp. IP29b_bin.148]|uniref:hypothetical protein n=1 Tax=Acaryochloris sp. IP29b_bin.148 TaxID=2969218 RepID=UPI0026155B9F|nr:hypothetical protein [Acaryochloris sp. IP29b_bin.148]